MLVLAHETWAACTPLWWWHWGAGETGRCYRVLPRRQEHTWGNNMNALQLLLSTQTVALCCAQHPERLRQDRFANKACLHHMHEISRQRGPQHGAGSPSHHRCTPLHNRLMERRNRPVNVETHISSSYAQRFRKLLTFLQFLAEGCLWHWQEMHRHER